VQAVLERLNALLRRSWFAVMALAAGCAHIDDMTPPPADWPELRVEEHGAAGTLENCSRYTSLLAWPPLGCAVIYFTEGVCRIWFMTEWVRQHELKHCRGFDHYGETTLRDAWNAHKAAK
jgi:hypothetical protein